MKHITYIISFLLPLCFILAVPAQASATSIVTKSIDKKSDKSLVVKEDAVGSVLMKDDDVVLFEKKKRGSKFRAYDSKKKRWRSFKLPKETNTKDWSIDYEIIPLKKKNQALVFYISNTNPDIIYFNMWNGNRWSEKKILSLPSSCNFGQIRDYQQSRKYLFLQVNCNIYEGDALVQLLSFNKVTHKIQDSHIIEDYDDQGGYYSGDRDYLYTARYRNTINYWFLDRQVRYDSSMFEINKITINNNGTFSEEKYHDTLDLSAHNLRRLSIYPDKNHIIIKHDPIIYQSRYKSVSTAPDSIATYNKKLGLIAALDTLTSDEENYYYISRLKKNGFSEKFATITRGKGARLIYFDKISESPTRYMLVTYREGINHKVRSTVFDEEGNIIEDIDVFGDSEYGVSRASGKVLEVGDKILFLRGNQYVYGLPGEWSNVKKVFPDGMAHLKFLQHYKQSDGKYVSIFSKKFFTPQTDTTYVLYAALFDQVTGGYVDAQRISGSMQIYDSSYPGQVSIGRNRKNALIEFSNPQADRRFLKRLYINN